MTTRPTRTFYRVVHTNPPTIRDFLSLKAPGRMPRNLRPRLQRMAEGISAYDTREAAETVARARRGKIGSFIAEMTVTESGAITYELTGDNGHYTL